MKIQIIGYKNHALRLQSIVRKLGYLDVRTFNHHKDDTKDLAFSDVYIIASPNETHVEWIKIIRSYGAGKYIFCEKPPASNLKQLKKIAEYDPRLFFNFNYRYSLISNIVKEHIETGELGKLVYASFISSHGLAFKKQYGGNWRFKGKTLASSILGNVGIHYVDLVGHLFGEMNNIKTFSRNVVSKSLPDSVYIGVDSELCSSSIFISYAAPFRNQATIIFDDGILELINGKVTMQRPRDVFDKKKMFKPAKRITMQPFFQNSRSYYDHSLINSVRYFFNHVDNDRSFPPQDYENSIKSTQNVLDQLT